MQFGQSRSTLSVICKPPRSILSLNYVVWAWWMNPAGTGFCADNLFLWATVTLQQERRCVIQILCDIHIHQIHQLMSESKGRHTHTHTQTHNAAQIPQSSLSGLNHISSVSVQVNNDTRQEKMSHYRIRFTCINLNNKSPCLHFSGRM